MLFLYNRLIVWSWLYVVQVVSTLKPHIDDYGILFKDNGDISISGKEYIVLLDINVDSLLESLQPISRTIRNIKRGVSDEIYAFDQLKPRRGNKALPFNEDETKIRRQDVEYNDTKIYSDITNTLTSSLQQHLKFLVSDIQNRQSEVEDFLRSLGKYNVENKNSTRTKRGLCNGCGSILSYVLGLSTEAELADTNEALTRYQDLSETIRKTVNMHTKIIKQSEVQIGKIESNVNRISTCLIQVEQDMSVLNRHLQRVEQVEYTLAHSVTMINSITYTSQAISDMANTFTNIKLGLEEMSQGRLSTHLMPPDIVLNIVQEIINKNLRAMFPATAEYLELWYAYIKIIPLPHSTLSFAISFPLEGDPHLNLKLYKIISLPHPISKDITLNYKNIPTYLAVSEDHTLYMEMNSINMCKRHNDKYICPIETPIYKEPAQSCALALFKNKDSNKICNKFFGPRLQKPIVIKAEGTWIYATNQAFELILNCPTFTNTLTIQIGSGTLNIEPNCRLTSKYFIIPSSLETHGHNIEKKFGLIHKFNLTLSDVELKGIVALNSTPLLSELMAVSNNKLDTTRVNSEISKLNYISKIRQANTYTGSFGTAIGSISFIIIGILIFMMCCFWKVSVKETKIDTKKKRMSCTLSYKNRNKNKSNLGPIELAENIDLEDEFNISDTTEDLQIEDQMLTNDIYRPRQFENVHSLPVPSPRCMQKSTYHHKRKYHEHVDTNTADK